jgi:hypothetical protein
MHFLQRFTHFSKTCCRPLITSKFLASELPFYGWKRPEIAWGQIWTVWRMFWFGSIDTLFSKPNTEFGSHLAPWNFYFFFTIMKREIRDKKFQSDQRSAARFREVGGALQEVHRLPREVLRKSDRHRTCTKFRLGVIRWVHELCKRPSYFHEQYYNTFFFLPKWRWYIYTSKMSYFIIFSYR